MSNETEMLRSLRSIDGHLKEQNRIFNAMNQNLFALVKHFKEWAEQQELDMSVEYLTDEPTLGDKISEVGEPEEESKWKYGKPDAEK